MRSKNISAMVVYLAFGAALASAGTISYTCDPTINATEAGTCAYLNSTFANVYDSTFTNANASIYIEMGITGLGESTTGYLNLVSYSTYRTALNADSSGDAVDTAAIASLPSTEPAIYSGGSIELTSALGEALGISGMVGTTASGAACFTPGTGGCYNGIITITTPANLSSETDGTQGLYWNQAGGTQPANDYDFYSVVSHETDEILGTASCISTTGSSLIDGCGGTNASAVDLFRYNAGSRVFISTTPGAYFSYNGGATNGVADGALYNTLSNGNDYADFIAGACPGGPFSVQDGTACPGSAPTITTDGGGEIAILDAVGFNVASSTPEPGTMSLFGIGLLAIGLYRRRSIRAAKLA